MAWLRRTDRTPRPGSGSPYTERSFIAAAMVCAIVVIAGVTTLISGAPSSGTSAGASSSANPGTSDDQDLSADQGDDTAAQANTAAEPGKPVTTPADGSCPALPPGDASDPIGLPQDTEWHPSFGAPLPASPSVGPFVGDANTGRCYTHTPTGAVLAAVRVSWTYRHTTDWGTAAQHLLAPGPGQQAYVQQRTTHTGANAKPVPASTDDGAVFPMGFRLLTHSADRADVDVITAPLAGNAGTHTVWTMVWAGDDWRLKLPDNGSPPPSTPVQQDDAYIAFDTSTMFADQSAPNDQTDTN